MKHLCLHVVVHLHWCCARIINYGIVFFCTWRSRKLHEKLEMRCSFRAAAAIVSESCLNYDCFTATKNSLHERMMQNSYCLLFCKRKNSSKWCALLRVSFVYFFTAAILCIGAPKSSADISLFLFPEKEFKECLQQKIELIKVPLLLQTKEMRFFKYNHEDDAQTYCPYVVVVVKTSTILWQNGTHLMYCHCMCRL